MPRRLSSALDALNLLAVALWLGGLVALGAIVAPTVFHNVPMPTAADAMTRVFRRFDRIAMACAAVAVITEALRLRARPSSRAGWLAAGLVVVAAALAVVEGVHFSPAIESLHRSGAVRGRGASGQELDELHRWAERLAKIEVALLFAVLASFPFRAFRLNASAGSLVQRQRHAHGHDPDVMVDDSGDHARFRP